MPNNMSTAEGPTVFCGATGRLNHSNRETSIPRDAHKHLSLVDPTTRSRPSLLLPCIPESRPDRPPPPKTVSGWIADQMGVPCQQEPVLSIRSVIGAGRQGGSMR